MLLKSKITRSTCFFISNDSMMSCMVIMSWLSQECPLRNPCCNGVSIIKIECKGIEKLLKNINTDKASGLDNISNKVLKNCAEELTPVISHIFQLSLETGHYQQTGWRCVRNAFIHWFILPSIPYDVNLCNNLWWGTVSNALLKSKITRSTCFFISNDFMAAISYIYSRDR
jgi:hypothetical protein